MDLLLRIAAFGSVQRFTQPHYGEGFTSNQIDLGVVCVATVAQVCLLVTLKIYPGYYHPSIEAWTQAILLLRILSVGPIKSRVNRLLAFSQLLSTTFWPMMTYLTMMLFLAIYFYAALGYILFSKPSSSKSPSSSSSAEASYFDSLQKSIMTIFQVFAGSNWHVAMIDVMKSHGSLTAGAYFGSFYLLANTILVNLIVAVFADVMMALRSWTHLRKKKDEESKRQFVRSLLKRQRSVFSWKNVQTTSKVIKDAELAAGKPD